MRTLTLTALVLAVGAADARAATSVSASGGTLEIQAASNRANQITAFDQGMNVIVRDLGDVVSPTAPCVWVDSHTASCPRAGLGHARVHSQDLGDTVNQFASLTSLIDGGAGDDTMRGGPDTDVLISGPGADLMHGGAGGIDRVDYSGHPAGITVTLDGFAGDGSTNEGDNVMPDVEWIYGTRFGDVLFGDADDNRIVGNRGNDFLFGQGGDDVTYSSSPLDGADEFNGGTGFDTINYNRQANAGVFVTLNGIADDGGAGEGDNVRLDVEHVRGGKGDDALFGNQFANRLDGYGGRDLIVGRGGGDTLLGGPHDDRIDAVDSFGIGDQVDGQFGVDTCISNPIDTEVNCEL